MKVHAGWSMSNGRVMCGRASSKVLTTSLIDPAKVTCLHCRLEWLKVLRRDLSQLQQKYEDARERVRLWEDVL